MFVNMSLLHFAVATVAMTRGLFEKTEGGEVALVSDRRESSNLRRDKEWERTSAVDIFLNLTTKKQNNFSYIKNNAYFCSLIVDKNKVIWMSIR